MNPLRSIRGRIQLWYGLVLLAVVAGFVGAICHREYRAKIARTDGSLQQILLVAIASEREGGVRSYHSPGRWGIDFERVGERVELGGEGFFLKAWDGEGRVVMATEFQPLAMAEVADDPKPLRDFRPRIRRGLRMVRVEGGQLGEPMMWAGYDLEPLRADLRPFFVKVAVVGILIWVGVMGAGWLIIGRALKVIGRMREAAEKIERGEFQERIEVDGTRTELGELAGFLNRTFDRLEGAFRRQVRFTADASHEMRTPLAAILSRGQLALRRERTAAEYREALEACVGSARHLSGLVEGLQRLSVADAGELRLALEERDLAELGREVCELVGALAEEKGIVLVEELELARGSFDEEQMRQVLLNLLGNALVYCGEGDEVRVRTGSGPQGIFLEVADTGPGISVEHLPLLFDRFYRVDAARAGRDGHAGLGLAICKSITEAHGGEIAVESEVGVGTRFLVRVGT